MVSDGAGGAIVTWIDERDPRGHYAQRVSAAGVALWAPDGVPISVGDISVIGDPTITSDGVGGAIITWDEYRSGNVDIYAQRVSAAGIPQWASNGVVLCAAFRQDALAGAFDSAGGDI